MEKFDIVTNLKAYSDKNNWNFIYGSYFWQNIEASNLNNKLGQLVFGALPFTFQPNFSNANKLVSGTWSGTILLGLKFDESGQEADLSETEWEKYQRRLKTLTDLMNIHISAFMCENITYEVTSCTLNYDLNKYDENIDFVAANIQIKEQ
jgi:hypothetical protein